MKGRMQELVDIAVANHPGILNLLPKETTVPDPIEEEAETTAKRGISSLSPPLQALAKIDRLLAEMEPRVVARILDFLTAINDERLTGGGK